MSTVQAKTAASFDASIGINIHPPYAGTAYANESLWLPELEAAGFEDVRTNWDENQPTMDAPIEQLAAAGVKVLITSDALYREGETPQSMVNYLVAHPQLAASISEIAGPNEINANFSDWQTGIVPFMQALYTAVKANPVTAHIQIVAPNFDNMQYDQNLATQLGSISQYVDLGDIHGTNGGDAQNAAYFTQVEQTATTLSGAKPLINTEGGYSAGTDSDGHAVPLPADAIQVDVLRYYFDDFAAGIGFSDLYQMIRQTPGDTSWGDDFSVVTDTGAPTPVYNEIKAVTTLLHDSGTPPATPGSLNFTLAGADSSTKTILLQKSDGSFWLSYWEDKQYYEYSVADANKGYTNVAPTQLTLQLAAAASGALYNPYSGSIAAVSTFNNATSINLTATTIPQLIEITPATIAAASPAATASTPDTLSLQISEDAWMGDAQYTVSVDGKQVGGTLTAHTLNTSGAGEQVSLQGNWGAGSHTVAIAFINDAWGGTAATDRNLYVKSIGYDGQTDANTSAAEYSNGSVQFSVGGANPAVAAPPDKLVLNLSEDYYQGDAQFSVAIDGKTLTTPQAVTVLHSSGGTEQFVFSGNFGAGNHDVAVSFLNDAYAGTPTTDRNLYVGSIGFDGNTFVSGGSALYSAGTQHFTVHS